LTDTQRATLRGWRICRDVVELALACEVRDRGTDRALLCTLRPKVARACSRNVIHYREIRAYCAPRFGAALAAV
jgi:hypothetical protein